MVEILNDRFEVIRTLGEGGQGRAFLARDVRDGGEVVVKELLVGQAADWKALELFERETKILRNLSHPAIPGYVDGFHLDEGGRVFLVQEYVEGEDLEALIEAGELFDEAGIREFLGQMLDTLLYLQGFSPPVIHRDMKPSNIIRDADGKYHLVDFGAVQLIVQDDVGGSTIVGTSGFMPPEQLMGRAQPASDIYSLGATCVQMASGIEPGDLPMERMKLQFRELVGLSDELCGVLDKMLEPQVAARFSDARALKKALETGVIAAAPQPAASTIGVADAAGLSPASAGDASPARQEINQEIRQKIASPPVTVPASSVSLGQDGVLRIDTLLIYKIPIIPVGLAILVGTIMVYSGLNGGDGGMCCTGIPLVFASIGYLFYRTIKRFNQYVERLRISENGIELEAGKRNGTWGSLVITKQVQIPLYQLRNCYLHIHGAVDNATSTQQRLENRKQSAICFVDAAGREQAFELKAVLRREKALSTDADRQEADREIRWLFELVQAQLTALTQAGEGDGGGVVLLSDGLVDAPDEGRDGRREDVAAPVEVAEPDEGPSW